MIQREFGTTGVRVPVVGQGTWQIRRDGLAALRLGIELGMTHIDTAELYTGAEEIVAEAIRGQRDRIFLVSKVMPSNASYPGVLRACDQSLRRLKTDYLDLYLIHWWNQTQSLDDTMRAMEDLVAAGKIRGIGVSNFEVKLLERAQKALAREKIACNQVLYHLRSRGIEHALLPYCEKHRIAIVGYSPFGQGRFPSPSSKQGKALAEIASKHGKTGRQVALRFLTRNPNVFVIPKASNPSHVRENAAGVGWELDGPDEELINSVFPLPDKNEPLDML